MAGFFSRDLIPIVIIYFALFFDFFLLEGYVIVQPTLTENHGWGTGYLTTTLAICKFTMMVVCPLVAYASSKMAAHHILIFGLVCLILSAFVLSISSSFAMFAIGKALHGVSSPAMTLSGMAILTQLSEESTRGKYSSYGYSGIAHGLLLAPLVTGVWLTHIGQFGTYMLITGLIAINAIGAVLYFYDITIFRKKTLDTSGDNKPCCKRPESPIEKASKAFEPITGAAVIQLLRIMLSNPKMITAVASSFLVGISIGANESTLPDILKGYEKREDMSEMYSHLIWTSASVAYTIFAIVSGFMADRISPIKLVFSGMTCFIITFGLMAVTCSTLPGVIVFLTITGGLTSYLDVAAYPLIASVVDTADIPNAYIIGYSIEYCIEQGGYAIGQYLGEVLYDINDNLDPVGYMVASVDTFLLLFGIFVCCVYPANRFIVTPSSSTTKLEDDEQKPQQQNPAGVYLESKPSPSSDAKMETTSCGDNETIPEII